MNAGEVTLYCITEWFVVEPSQIQKSLVSLDEKTSAMHPTRIDVVSNYWRFFSALLASDKTVRILAIMNASKATI